MWTTALCIVCTEIRLLLLICFFISSFFVLSNFQTLKVFRHTFIRNCEAYKVETRYTSGQWVDVACILESDCCCFFISLFIFLSLQFYFSFCLSLQLAKIKILHLQNCFNIVISDGYGQGYVSFAHYLLYFAKTCNFDLLRIYHS